MKQHISILLTSLLAAQSFAAMDIKAARGERRTSFQSPGGKTELCIVPQKINADFFSKGDNEDEDKLCALNFYADSVVCPKQNSTNPGILIAEMVDGLAKDQAEAKMCKGPSDDLSVEAKFKQSISCSYTPSILAYYQFSRLLDAGNVPTAVVRTMDRSEHSRQAKRALSYGLTGVIKSTWESFAGAHKNGGNNKVFDNSGEFVYGALSDNPKREERYTEVSGRGSYETRYERFLQQDPFKRVASSKSVIDIAGTTDFKEAAQTVIQMKDVSDMILLDTLFSQDDRIGNIHYKFAWYIIDEKGKVDRKKSKAKLGKDGPVIPQEELEKYKTSGVLLKEMILKDNDCGVDITKRSNMMRKISAIEQVRHMSAKTYSRLMAFAKIAKNEDTEAWMKREMLFTDKDLKGEARSFQSNLDRAVSVLKKNCEAGILKLDLNIKDFAPGATKIQANCDGTIVK